MPLVGPQDLRAVLVGLLIVLSGFQYLNEHFQYRHIVDMVKQTPAYKNKMKSLELEHSQARTNKKNGSKNKIQLVLSELHMKKTMPPKGRVLAFMIKFSMLGL